MPTYIRNGEVVVTSRTLTPPRRDHRVAWNLETDGDMPDELREALPSHVDPDDVGVVLVAFESMRPVYWYALPIDAARLCNDDGGPVPAVAADLAVDGTTPL